LCGLRLSDLVLDDNEQLPPIVNDRVEHLSAIGLCDYATARERLLRREENRDQVSGLDIRAGFAQHPPLSRETGDRKLLQLTIRGDET